MRNPTRVGNEEDGERKMSEPKFTPGPWFVAGARVHLDRQQWHAVSRYDEANKRDQNIALVGYDPKTGEGYFDAKLLGAAPELYWALKESLQALNVASRQLTDDHKMVLSGRQWGWRTAATIEAALAKAEGK